MLKETSEQLIQFMEKEGVAEENRLLKMTDALDEKITAEAKLAANRYMDEEEYKVLNSMHYEIPNLKTNLRALERAVGEIEGIYS